MESDDLRGHRGRRALLGGSAAATLGLLGLSAGPAHAGSGGRESRNKRRVAEAFRAAAEHGTLNQANDFYLDTLHEDAIWTVASVPPRDLPEQLGLHPARPAGGPGAGLPRPRRGQRPDRAHPGPSGLIHQHAVVCWPVMVVPSSDAATITDTAPWR